MELVPEEGSVNHTRLCGGVCVKLLKEIDTASDIYCELVATPAARAVGAKVPELIAFDDSGDYHPGPVVLWERGKGQALGDLTAVPDLGEIYLEVADQAKLWHAITAVDDPHGWLDQPELANPNDSLSWSADRIEPEIRAWLEQAFERLASAREGEYTFGNWDLHAHNILIENGRLSMVLDWGDAGFGDPALNFVCFPAEFLPAVVERFGEPDEGFIPRLLRETLCYAVNAYNTPDRPTLRHTGMKRWRSYLKLYEMNLPDPWAHWLGSPPPWQGNGQKAPLGSWTRSSFC